MSRGAPRAPPGDFNWPYLERTMKNGWTSAVQTWLLLLLVALCHTSRAGRLITLGQVFFFLKKNVPTQFICHVRAAWTHRGSCKNWHDHSFSPDPHWGHQLLMPIIRIQYHSVFSSTHTTGLCIKLSVQGCVNRTGSIVEKNTSDDHEPAVVVPSR